MPCISIIVPIYNTEKYLDRCVRSILTQTFIDFELLLINDGSTDLSGKICDKYAELDSRVRVFHKTNGGVSSARNLGLDNAVGEWITFCDSDDWVDATWLYNFVNNTNDADLICQGIRFDYSNLLLPQKSLELAFNYKGSMQGCLQELFKSKSVGYTVNKCFKTTIIQHYNLRFDTQYNFKEDEEFVLRYLTCVSKALSISVASYNYIIPDFDLKYKFPKSELNLYESCYKSVKCIYGNMVNEVSLCYLDTYTITLLKSFRTHPSMRNLRRYRENVGKQVLNTHLYPITKYILYIDLIGVVSFVVLFIHSKMRTIITRKKRKEE